MRLGIDFGTTRTVVAVALSGRHAVVAFDNGDEFVDYLPGIAGWDGHGWQFGWDARNTDGTFIRSIKRVVSGLAPDDAVPGVAPTTTALELVTGFARYVRAMLREHSNLDGNLEDGALETTLAVPANANTRQRYLTLEAWGRAGFDVRALHNEPTAAAVEFAHRHLETISPRSPKRYVVVYDLGGGTFDTSAVSLTGRRFELIASEGIARLGGDDFDQVLLDMATERAGVELDASARARALERCREAKESLRPNTRKLMLDVPALADQPIVVDTADLYQRCAPLIESSLELLDEVFGRLPDVGIDPENPRELGGVYLVGGGVQFPPVARALRARYARKIRLAPQPHAATAVGLAVCADPDAEIFIKEAITRHFGVWREAEEGHEKVFDRILSKDTVPDDDQPIVIERVYRPSHRVGALRFLECAQLSGDGQPAGDVTPWTQVLFPYDPALVDTDLTAIPVDRTADVSGEEIAEIYTYRPDGSIAVDIENRTHGYQRHYVLGCLR